MEALKELEDDRAGSDQSQENSKRESDNEEYDCRATFPEQWKNDL